jgi:tetratricopeptide (TPR) repeat protein
MQEKMKSDNVRPRKPAKRKDFEIQFYENLLLRRPDFVNVLIYLGDAYTKRGLYGEGLAVDRKLAVLRPDDPVVHYNLACSLSLLGYKQEAFRALKKAVLLGYDEFNHMLKDRDLEAVRALPEFQVFLKKIQRLQKQ